MPAVHINKVWLAVICLLLVIIVAGTVIIWLRFPRAQFIEISIEPPVVSPVGIFVDGAVNNPGYYSLRDSDNLNDLLQMAGSIKNDADRYKIRVHVPITGETEQAQKIDINYADSWLLEALPGIGSTLSQRIVEYREQHGPFRNINELTLVDGITISLYEKIKSLITVAE